MQKRLDYIIKSCRVSSERVYGFLKKSNVKWVLCKGDAIIMLPFVIKATPPTWYHCHGSTLGVLPIVMYCLLP